MINLKKTEDFVYRHSTGDKTLSILKSLVYHYGGSHSLNFIDSSNSFNVSYSNKL